MTSLAGKRILVTGAGSGIGRAAVRMFRDHGAELILVGRRLAALQESLPDAEHVVLDHTLDAAVAAFADHCGALDGMFLAAGALKTGSVAGTSTSDFEAMLAANLTGTWLMAHHLGPRLKDAASVVLVGSNIGLRAIPDSAAYSVAKAGVHMLAKVLALEWAPRGIRCNAIAPGPIHTPMVDARLAASADPAGELARLSGVNPLRRLGTTQEVAALAVHLLSDESTWTTGTVMTLDGGADAVF
ncbi:MAG: SDR family oxidoreductase [Geothrix sp.]|uniref:SDR family NAD(P)-dependent oxidoreductase n=1 Tax=Geothrix sp. TaxID=1962974 RepID=UPI001845AC59|nr:SDR family oxidoreductase [Geothrix sp.]NWJ39939.1 SDR family oxidoreductase [Geothrix sp.]WIL22049.1 MAG: SDR family oxidoreductase [Geothrix sp.]